MAHDVFISHAHKDKEIADALCEKLESAQVKCWIAQRDMPAGGDWTEATRTAIGSSHLMVLLLSENASAAVHMEREMAHAFYTKRIIIPLRLADTFPRRDLLFYLGNARSFDAFGPTAGQQLEAFATAIHEMVQDRTGAREATTFHRPQGAAAIPIFSESWIGALQASHYRSLQILKRVAIVIPVAGAIFVFWLVHQQSEREPSLGEDNSRAWRLRPGPSPDSSPQASADLSRSKSSYAYTRFGLWVTPTNGAAPETQSGTQDPSAVSRGSQPQRSTSPPGSGNPETAREGEDLQNKGQNRNSGPEDHPRTGIRRPGHRGKSRPKSHPKKVNTSLSGRIAEIKRRLISVWQHFEEREK